MSNLLISVIICTYNRAKLLRDAIESICAQTLDPAEFELIVVDNNSTDDTRFVVESFHAPFALRYVFEPKQGLSHARNCGWQAAQGKYVGYLDDDAKAPLHWLALAAQIIEEYQPAIFGGPIKEYFNSSRPSWFHERFLGDSMVTFTRPGPLELDKWLFGGNLFLRHDVIAELGGFSTSLGMSGKKVFYGEETLIIIKTRTLLPDELVYAHPDLYIHHLIRPEKTKRSWMIRSAFSRGRSIARLSQLLNEDSFSSNTLRSFVKIIIESTIVLIKIMISPYLWKRSKYDYPNIESYRITKLIDWATSIGVEYERILGH